MKYNLDRARVTQTMCVMTLYGPNCNAAQPVCIGSGSWNMGFRGILGEDCCGLCGNGLMDQVQVVVQQGMPFENSQTAKEEVLCHTQQAEISWQPLTFPPVNTYYKATEKDQQKYHSCSCKHRLENDPIKAKPLLPMAAGYYS